MERKFPHVFNVKTPQRTYYLAADSDDVMRYWVNCICNVCGLQDLSKLPIEEGGLAPESPPQDLNQSLEFVSVAGSPGRSSNNATLPGGKSPYERSLQTAAAAAVSANEERMYQNNDFAQRVLREKGVSASPDSSPINSHRMNAALAREEALSPSSSTLTNRSPLKKVDSEDAEHDYYNDVSLTSTSDKSLRKRPENLKLNEGTGTSNDVSEPSPALSTSSGPYIPICECFSGSPVLANPQTRRNGPSSYASYENHFAPLNSLSRNNQLTSPLNIGQLNLTEGPGSSQPSADGGRSSDESESVFTDDDEASSHSGSQAGVRSQNATLSETEMRRLRPSDSSIENENIGWTAMQRFSKIPTEEKKCLNSNDAPPRPPKRVNDAAVIGPLDSSSCVVEDRYEIPRSHRNPHQTVTTPGPITDGAGNSASMQRRSHFYTNAAPSNLEGQVFRYDFSEVAMPPPVINRNLKPKHTMMQIPSRSCDPIETPLPQGGGTNPRNSMFVAGSRQSLQMTPSRSDDKLQYLDLDHTNGAPEPSIRNFGSASAQNILITSHGGGTMPMPSIKHSISEHNSNTGPLRWVAGSSSALTAAAAVQPPTASRDNSGRGIVYKTVDFVKTEAFNRTRQDAEMNRASNKDK